jgi:hypothetical protein
VFPTIGIATLALILNKCTGAQVCHHPNIPGDLPWHALCPISLENAMLPMTLEDTVEFFNLVLSLKLNQPEKQALVTSMRQL